MENNELVHYGVKGMKWGVRKRPASATTSNRKPSRKKAAPTSTKKKTVSEKPKMTDEELARAVRRLQLEKQYRELSPKQVSAGKKFVNHVVNQVVVPAATEAAKQAVKEYLTNAAKSTVAKQSNKK